MNKKIIIGIVLVIIAIIGVGAIVKVVKQKGKVILRKIISYLLLIKIQMKMK